MRRSKENKRARELLNDKTAKNPFTNLCKDDSFRATKESELRVLALKAESQRLLELAAKLGNLDASGARGQNFRSWYEREEINRGLKESLRGLENWRECTYGSRRIGEDKYESDDDFFGGASAFDDYERSDLGDEDDVLSQKSTHVGRKDLTTAPFPRLIPCHHDSVFCLSTAACAHC